MIRSEWEGEAIAKRNGWRGGLKGEIERRARERRQLRLERDIVSERRWRERRDAAIVLQWCERFDAIRKDSM